MFECSSGHLGLAKIAWTEFLIFMEIILDVGEILMLVTELVDCSRTVTFGSHFSYKVTVPLEKVTRSYC